MRGRICGTGSYIPEHYYDNNDLAKFVETNDEWIRERTGIVRRHIAEEDTTVSMAIKAAKNALTDAKLNADDLDLILVSTITPNTVIPSTACEVQKELGAVNSDFENPNGLNAQNHYTTARDMALITQELLENHEEFKTIAQTQQYTIGATNLVNQARTFQQSDLMFYEGNDYYYPKTIAGKTGYTDEALNTLVSCAADDNLELISVVLKTHGKNVYPDSVNLLEYGFNNFAKYTIADYEDSADFKEIDPNAYVVLPENVNFQSLDYEITQDDTNSSTGTVTYTYQGNPVGKAAVTLSDEYLQKDNTENEAQVSGDKSDSETQKQAQSTIPREVILVICVIAAVLLLIIVWRAVLKHLRKKKVETNRKRRREVDKD